MFSQANLMEKELWVGKTSTDSRRLLNLVEKVTYLVQQRKFQSEKRTRFIFM